MSGVTRNLALTTLPLLAGIDRVSRWWSGAVGADRLRYSPLSAARR